MPLGDGESTHLKKPLVQRRTYKGRYFAGFITSMLISLLEM